MREAFGAEVVGDELLHLAAALADEADDRDVGSGVARQHREQHRLADAGAGEDAHALAAAAGEEGVDGADAEIELALDALAPVGGRRLVAQGAGDVAQRQRPLAVDGLAERVDDAAEPARMRIDGGNGVGDLGLAAEADALGRAEGHEQGAAVAEADHFAREPAAVAGENVAAAADGEGLGCAPQLEQHAEHGGDAAVAPAVGDLRQLAQKVRQTQRRLRGGADACFAPIDT